MYREPAPTPTAAPPGDFLYAVADRERRRVTAIAAFQCITFPVAAAALVSALTTPAAGLAALVGGAAFAFWWWRRSGPGGGGVLLRVDGDELSVLGAASKELRARLRLADLVDVTLDTKTIRPVMDGNNPIPGLRMMNSQPLPEVDETRIVLVSKSGELPLTEAYLANVDVTEWFGKIRVFLRKHGWVPESERDEDG